MIDVHEDPGVPERRGPGRYLWWLLACQPGRAWAGATLGAVWMVLMTLSPYVLSRAVDDGLVPGDTGALVAWSAVLLGLQAFNAWVSIMRHRVMTRLRMDANFRTVKSLIAQAVRLGAALPRQTGAAEVVTIGVTDVQQISQSLTMTGPGVGSAVAYVVVCGQLLSISAPLGAVVVLGVPVIALLVGPLLGRLRGAEAAYREQQGALTSRIGDLAGGLRVLNGLGGKELYADAFRRDSRRLVAQGYRVGAVTSWVQALGVGLPTLFLAVVTWLAARSAAQGDISVGQLVAVYGYVAVLVAPVAFFIEAGYDVTRGIVAAGRVVRFLSLEPDSAARPATADAPAGPAPLSDPVSGVEVAPGTLTALVSARPAESAALADRLAGFCDSAVTWGAVRLTDVAPAQVRDRILIADNEADLFAGALRDVVAGRWAEPARTADRTRVPAPARPRDRDVGGNSNSNSNSNDDRAAAAPGTRAEAGPRAGAGVRATAGARSDTAVAEALRAAVAEDVVSAMPDGLDSVVEAQGRNLSGGQRQRIRLARALLADPEVLIAVEPTSALDAHTEAAVAQRLREARAGRTTVVTGTSPLLLDQADTVYYLVDGRVAAGGRHRDLLDAEPGYRSLVARGAEDDAKGGPQAGPGTGRADGPGDGFGHGEDPDGGPRRSKEALR